MPYGCQQQQFERKNTNKTAEKTIFRKENLQFEKKNKKKQNTVKANSRQTFIVKRKTQIRLS